MLNAEERATRRRLKREYLESTGQVGCIKDSAYYHRIIEREKTERAEKSERQEAWAKKTHTLFYRISDWAYGMMDTALETLIAPILILLGIVTMLVAVLLVVFLGLTGIYIVVGTWFILMYIISNPARFFKGLVIGVLVVVTFLALLVVACACMQA